MGFRREYYMLIISIVVVLTVMLVTKFMNMMPNGILAYLLGGIIVLAGIGFFGYETYIDLKQTNYKTKYFIIAADFVMFVALAVMGVMNLVVGDYNDYEALKKYESIINYAALILLITLLWRSFLKSQRFNKIWHK